MRHKSTLVVLTALTFVFGYYTWEHFSIKKENKNKLEKVSEKKKRLMLHHPESGMDKAMEQEFDMVKDPALNRIPRE